MNDAAPGIRRIPSGKGFRYVDPRGRAISDMATLRRIRALVIPPAWRDVWICPSARGHIQAAGRDARRRKVYRYHPRFIAWCAQTKYEHILEFAAALPEIRVGVDEALERPGLDRDKVLATVVRLLELTLIRVGNEEYARTNGSFGLTTLRVRHVDIDGSTVRFRFRGKHGKEHTVGVRDRRLARIVQRCYDLPGQLLFQYLDDDGRRRSVEAADVNEFLRRVSGADFSAKDFRTWAGTVLTAHALAARGAFQSRAEAKRNVAAAIKDVASRLGNTAAVCRSSYVHPAIFEAYNEGALQTDLTAADDGGALSSAEQAVLALLRKRCAISRRRAADLASPRRALERAVRHARRNPPGRRSA